MKDFNDIQKKSREITLNVYINKMNNENLLFVNKTVVIISRKGWEKLSFQCDIAVGCSGVGVKDQYVRKR